MVTTNDDMQLLQDYTAHDSQEAFATLVSRHLNLVYSVALRQTGNQHEAEEVAQAVFVVLARKARSLRTGTVLSGWLYETARLTAANARRSEIRRQNREQEAYMQSTLNEPAPDQWERVGPLIEQAMSGLSEADRNAIVLRYFENKPLREVGAALEASEDAAKMRVNRALEKLRVYFQKRGITLSTAALGEAIAAHSVQAAPAGLSALVIAAACQGTALTATTLTLAKGTIKLMAWTKLSFVAGTAAVAVITWQYTTIRTQQQEAVTLQREVEQMSQQNERQLATIKEFQQGGSGNVSSFSRPLLATGARRSTGGAGFGVAGAAATKPTHQTAGDAAEESMRVGIQSMLRDPDTFKEIAQQEDTSVKLQFAPLVKQLNLTPDQRDAFFDALIGPMTNSLARNFGMTNGTNSGGSSASTATSTASMQKQIRAILGDSGYDQYQVFQSAIPARSMLDQYKTSFGDHPLTSDQEQQLLQLIATEINNNATVLDPDTGQPMVVNPGDNSRVRETMLQQEQISRRVFEQASAFLSPDQVQSLGISQSNLLSMMKAVIPFETKMLGGESGGK